MNLEDRVSRLEKLISGTAVAGYLNAKNHHLNAWNRNLYDWNDHLDEKNGSQQSSNDHLGA